jgi:hypothetical protein
VQAVPGVLFPEIVHEGDLLASAYALPEKALKEVGFSPPPSDQPATPGVGYATTPVAAGGGAAP